MNKKGMSPWALVGTILITFAALVLILWSSGTKIWEVGGIFTSSVKTDSGIIDPKKEPQVRQVGEIIFSCHKSKCAPRDFTSPVDVTETQIETWLTEHKDAPSGGWPANIDFAAGEKLIEGKKYQVVFIPKGCAGAQPGDFIRIRLGGSDPCSNLR